MNWSIRNDAPVYTQLVDQIARAIILGQVPAREQAAVGARLRVRRRRESEHEYWPVKTYDETLNTVKDKEVVMGTVTSMNKREVVVNIGFKSDGVVPMSEFRYNPDLKIGDEVEVYIESQEDKKDN